MKIYLSGPMTGIENYNYPEFNRVAGLLRAKGYEVENPAEVTGNNENTWSGYMRLALAKLIKCDTIVLLDKWETSRGARIEKRLARDIGMRVLTVSCWPDL